MHLSTPTILMVLATLLTAAAAIMTQRENYKKEEKAAARDQEILALNKRNSELSARILDAAQDSAARMGNNTLLQEVIEARSRLLSVERRGTDDIIGSIVAKLPSLTSDFEKLKREKVAVVASMQADFALCWTPSIRYWISEFDRLVDGLRARGIQFVERKNDEFPLTTASEDQMAAIVLRTVKIGRITICLAYQPANCSSMGMSPGQMLLRVSEDGVRNPIDGTCMVMDFLEGSGPVGITPKPKDGIPPKALTDAIRVAIGKMIERLLVASSAKMQ